MRITRLRTRLAALCLGLAAALPGAAPAQTSLNASVWFPDTHPLTKYGYVEWARKVEQASKGDLKINVFTGTALLPVNAHLSGLRDGIAHITYHAGTYTPSDLPEDNVLAVLGITLSDPLVTTFAVADFYLNDAAMQAMFKRQKIVFLGAYASIPYNLICRKDVQQPADFKGLKIRTPGPIHNDFVRSLSATPVSVPSSEMFTGLDKGQLDCVINGVNELKSRSLWDVAKFANLMNLGPYFAGWEWAAHGPTWAKLSTAQRRVLLDTIADATVEAELAYIAAGQDAVKDAPKHGAKVSEPSDALKKALADFAAQARATAVKEGTERFKIKDAEGLVQRFEATVQKWKKLVDGVDRANADALKALLRKNLYDGVDAARYGL